MEINSSSKQRPKTTDISIMIAEKIDFKPKLDRRDKEGHGPMI